jgi:hypothetical protein
MGVLNYEKKENRGPMRVLNFEMEEENRGPMRVLNLKWKRKIEVLFIWDLVPLLESDFAPSSSNLVRSCCCLHCVASRCVADRCCCFRSCM